MARIHFAPFVVLATMLACIPVMAEVDLSGEWVTRVHEDQIERLPGPALGDYLGLPLNAAGRMRADAWSASLLTLPEWQCRPHSSDFVWGSPSNLRIYKEVNPVTRQTTAIHLDWQRSMERAIYMDGRPRPPEEAARTWAGFSTGKWDGDMLTITTTHLKEGYIRRNGPARSEKATVTEHLIRHGDWLTAMIIVNDPVYLTEPMIRTIDYELDVHQQIPPYPCDVVREVERGKGSVPHVLPGKNTFVREFSEQWGVPFEATRGGAETMYPEYRKKMKGVMGKRPKSGGGD